MSRFRADSHLTPRKRCESAKKRRRCFHAHTMAIYRRLYLQGERIKINHGARLESAEFADGHFSWGFDMRRMRPSRNTQSNRAVFGCAVSRVCHALLDSVLGIPGEIHVKRAIF